jgi:hypothetical protein
MSTERRAFSDAPHLMVGVALILLGLVFALERMGVVEARALLQFWPVLLILFGAALIVQALWGDPDASLRRRHDALGGFWVLLVIVALFSWQAQRRSESAARGPDADTVSLFALMGSDQRSSLATRFRGGEMTSVMGQTRLDLREAVIPPGEEAVIDVFTLMGSAVVQVPRTWVVTVQTAPVFAGVRDQRGLSPEEIEAADAQSRERRRGRDRIGVPRDGSQAPATLEPVDTPPDGSPPPRVVLRGFIMMGALTIRS